MMGYWENLANFKRDGLIVDVIGKYLIANTFGNKVTSSTAKLLSTGPSEAGPITETQLSQLDELIKEIHEGNGLELQRKELPKKKKSKGGKRKGKKIPLEDSTGNATV